MRYRKVFVTVYVSSGSKGAAHSPQYLKKKKKGLQHKKNEGPGPPL